MRVRRRPPSVLLVLVLLVVAGWCADRARAEELIELENGVRLRGEVLQESEETILVDLTGFNREARVTIRRSRIVRRMPTTPQSDHSLLLHGADVDWSAMAEPVAATSSPTPAPSSTRAPDTPRPGASAPGFFTRLARVITLSVPEDPTGRAFLAVLLLGVLIGFVSLGGRLAEIEDMSLGRTTILALLLGTLLGSNVVFPDQLLRPDRAGWVLPLQAFLWTLAALAVLRCGLARVTLLLAFVSFSIAVVLFTSGAMLVTY